MTGYFSRGFRESRYVLRLRGGILRKWFFRGLLLGFFVGGIFLYIVSIIAHFKS
jgi:hypothetical protein